MKNVNNEALHRICKKGKLALCVIGAVTILGGCMPREIATNANVKYDVIDPNTDNLVTSGISQTIDVPGENFKLLVNYKCILQDGARWTVTSDKEMYMDVCTMGLDDNTKVYIDNVHIDTTIRSVYPSVDGITQDTMDDRIHNSLMVGFPISDFNTYSSINCIEGQNDTFVHGSFTGFNGYSSGSVSEKRYVESDYLKAGVYANKIASVIDLIIQKADGTVRCVSVPSTIGVSVWPYVEKVDNSGKSFYTYYYVGNDGKVVEKELSVDEYEERVGRQRKFGQ